MPDAQSPYHSRYAIGQTYGGGHRIRATPKIIEWEWVHAGRDFARAHPMDKLRGGMLIVIAFLFVHLALAGLLAWENLIYGLVIVSVDLATLMLVLWRRRPAWPFVWLVLISCFPISLPLIIYWADGVRPNLIYRHRFERLMRSREGIRV